jgi:hypothetical protein
VRDVPEDNWLCEFDCLKPQCKQGEWKNCERRLKHASWLLVAAKKPATEVVAESKPGNDVVYHDFDRF